MIRRILKLDPKCYEVVFEALAGYVAAPNERDVTHATFAKLSGVGEPKREPTRNPDLVYRTASSTVTLDLLESERDILLRAVEQAQWPAFALGNMLRAVEQIRNAERVEAT